MHDSHVIYLILHGAIILFISNVIGYVLGRTLASSRSSAHQKDAWRMAHSSNSVVGTLLIASGAVVPVLTLSSTALSALMISLPAGGYGFLFGTLIAAITGNRGLRFKAPFSNRIAFACYMVGILGSTVGIILLVVGAMNSL